MTLLEAVAHRDLHAVEHALADALQSLPGIAALVALPSASGTNAICLVDEAQADFFRTELATLDALVKVRRAHPQAVIDMLCVSTQDAERMEFADSGAHIYRFG
ncbi:MAG: hypothetical protein FIA92_01630 [Chloroflexi bacterium]|nr:hypothetical protein [Chloroflexota bacterium]